MFLIPLSFYFFLEYLPHRLVSSEQTTPQIHHLLIVPYRSESDVMFSIQISTRSQRPLSSKGNHFHRVIFNNSRPPPKVKINLMPMLTYCINKINSTIITTPAIITIIIIILPVITAHLIAVLIYPMNLTCRVDRVRP